MADAADEKKGSPRWVFWAVFLLCVTIAAGSSFLYKESERARTELEDAKKDYEEMKRLKKVIAEAKLRNRRLPASNGTGGDPIAYLGRKATQAGIPQNLFQPTLNNRVKLGAWTETMYTVTLRGTKDALLSRTSVVDFIIGVETERPSIKSKNLNLTFAGSGDFSAVTLTFAQYQRE